MQQFRITRSQTKSIVIQPTTLHSTPLPSISSTDEVDNLVHDPTPTISSSLPMSNNNDHEVPPHMNTPDAPPEAPAPPAIDPNLQHAMTALFQAMAVNMQAVPPPRIRE